MKFVRTLACALAVGAMALTALPAATVPAQAEHEFEKSPHDRFRVHSGNAYGGHARYHREHRKHRHHGKHIDRDVAAAIAGITGLAIVGGALAHPRNDYRYRGGRNYQRDHGNRFGARGGHDKHRHHGSQRSKPVRHAGSLEPWTPGWYTWCARRYRSFDPDRGTFRGYDGRDHFCVPR